MGVSARLTGRPEFVVLNVATYIIMPDCIFAKFVLLFSPHSPLYNVCIWKGFVEETYVYISKLLLFVFIADQYCKAHKTGHNKGHKHQKLYTESDNPYAFLSFCHSFFRRNSPQWARASSFTRFLDHTQRHTTVG